MKFVFAAIFLAFSFVGINAQQAAGPVKKKVYVMGNVAKPSAVDFREGLTVKQAIAEAGGLIKDKKGKNVRVYRLTGEPCSQRKLIKIDLKAILKNKTPDFFLEALDILDIDYRPAKELYVDLICNSGERVMY